jgi:hypothetical protein
MARPILVIKEGMRTLARCALVSVLVGCGGASKPTTPVEPARFAVPQPRPAVKDLAVARDLDGEGVRAFSEGRFQSALIYFEAARRFGGPSLELWNIAKCQQRLEDPAAAAATLEQYLAEKDLSPQDRVEAQRELVELRNRPVRVTIVTIPANVTVLVDDRKVGRSPVSLDLTAGEHRIRAEEGSSGSASETVTLRRGRSAIVELYLRK